MKHFMKLRKEPFDAIKSGRKTVELRLYDEKRRAVKEGDEIGFTCVENGEKLTATVSAVRVFKDFYELFSAYDSEKLGYGEGEMADASDMLAYYTPDQIAEYGVVGIELADVRPVR